MHFIQSSAVLGEQYENRTFRVGGAFDLPNGDYTFEEFYCTDHDCDCRKTILKVYHNDVWVSSINYGWENPKFYRKWFKHSENKNLAEEMSGLSIDFLSPDIIDDNKILKLTETMLDSSWQSEMRDNYKNVRKQVDNGPINIISLAPKVSRNAPYMKKSSHNSAMKCARNGDYAISY